MAMVANANNKKRNDMEDKFLDILIKAQSQNYHLDELQKELCDLFDVSYCATLMKNVLCNRFTNEAKKHVGKKINEVPELAEMLKAIEIVEKHCS